MTNGGGTGEMRRWWRRADNTGHAGDRRCHQAAATLPPMLV